MTSPIRDFIKQQTNDPNETPMQAFLRKYALRAQVSSAVGRRTFLQQHPPEIAKKQILNILSADDLDDELRQDLLRMVDKIDTPDREGVGEDFARGVASGIVTTPTQVADLVGAIGDVPSRMIGNEDNMFRTFRNKMQETTQSIREEIDPRGTAGGVGEFTGALAGGILPYGAAARATGVAVTKLAPASKIAGAITKATGPTASLGQRVAANVATGVPVNALQAASMDDATGQEKLKTFAIGVGADALFGAGEHLLRGRKSAAAEKELHEPLSDARKAAVQKQLGQAKTLVAERKLAKEQDKLTRKAAYKLFKQENPEKSWNKLSGEERKVYIDRIKPTAPVSNQGKKGEEANFDDIIDAVDERVLLDPIETPTFTRELQTVELDRPVRDLLALPPDEAKNVFKKLKLPWDKEQSTLDNLIDSIRRVTNTDPTNKLALQDELFIGQLRQELTPPVQNTIQVDPASPAGIMELAKREPGPVLEASIERVELDPKLVRKWAKTDPKLLAPEELSQFDSWLDDRIGMLTPGENDPYIALRKKVTEEIAMRAKPHVMSDVTENQGLISKPVTMNSMGQGGSSTGAATGFVFGVMTTEDDDPDRWAKIGMAIAIGAGAMKMLPKLRKTNTAIDVIPNTADISKRIISVDKLNESNPQSTMSKMREFYISHVRSTFGIERPLRIFGLDKLPAQINSAKQAQMWGRHVAMTENWLTSNPAIVTRAGEVVNMLDDAGMPIKPLQDILVKTAKGHKESFAKVNLARTSIELIKNNKPAPMTLAEAEQVLLNAPDFLHQAADEFRQYHKGLLRVLMSADRLSLEGYKRMANEEWYAPIMRIVGADEELRKAIQKNKLNAPKALFQRTGRMSDALVLDPYDATVEMTARILRSAEHNNIVQALWQNSRMMPAGAGDIMMRKADVRTSTIVQRVLKKAEELKVAGNFSDSDAKSLAQLLDLDQHQPTLVEGRYQLSGYEDGQIVSYSVDKEVYDTFKAMTPQELDWAQRLAVGVARTATSLIVHNPVFIGSQFIIDTFNNTLMSQYRFRPGVDSVRGWWNVMRGDPRIKDLMAAGGPGTIQSLPYTGKLSDIVQAVKTQGDTPLKTALNQIKEFQPIEAYKTLMRPFAEAGRVGEYLRALDHGASVLEATYAAWNVGGNMKLQGAAATMRALNMMSLFLRPAISGLDELTYQTGLPHPRRGGSVDVKQALKFTTRGVALTIPSMLLWYANKDDEKINELRRTETGGKYWYFRIPWNDAIGKIRKPHVIGHLFGTIIEGVLDKIYQDNPQSIDTWVKGIASDAMVNLLPTIGVVPLALVTNSNLNGGQLVPEGDKALEPSLWGYSKGSYPARVIADKLSSYTVGMHLPAIMERAMSPAALDLTVRTLSGMIGQDVVQMVDYAHEWTLTQNIPPAAEMPVVGRLFGQKEGNSNLGSIREFYRIVERVDRAARSVDHYAQSNPQKLLTYMPQVTQELAMQQMVADARGRVNQFWKAINDIRSASDEMIPPDTKRMLSEAYIKQILASVQGINLVGRKLLD